MTRGRRSGLTGWGGVRNEGGGGLRMGIRGKSRGGERRTIRIQIQYSNHEDVKSINIKIELDNVSVRIPYRYLNDSSEFANMYLIIYGSNIKDNDAFEELIKQHWCCVKRPCNDADDGDTYVLKNVLIDNHLLRHWIIAQQGQMSQRVEIIATPHRTQDNTWVLSYIVK